MATIALREYYREIEKWLDHGLYDQVISHCRYILNHYPKAIEPYQLLGKAYLENKQYSEAIDLFQRVLSSRLDDFVSHIGMSIIREDEGNLNEAIWHMERAYEIQPSNKAIQGELRRLIGKRDGIEPVKINLNRSALARMYLKGNLQSQAIAEIRMALTEDPKRPDLQVLLANAYYELHQETEAADVASQLLSTFPYCFDANLILYHIAESNNKTKEAQQYLNRLVELDPYAAFLSESTITLDMVADDAVMIETMIEPTEQGELINPNQSDWSFAGESTTGQQLPSPADWMSDFTDQTISEPKTEAETQSPSTEIPDWLRDAGWDEASAESESEAEQEIILPFFEEEIDIEPGEIPDWLKELSPIDETKETQNVAPLGEQEIESILAESTLSSTPSESVDWFRELEITAKPTGQEIAPLQGDEETPVEELSLSIISSEGSPEEERVIPDWLNEQSIGEGELSLEEEPPISELDTKPVVIQFESTNIPLELSPEESPDWVREYLESQIETELSASTNLSPAIGEKEIITPEESAVPDWLKETLEEQPQSNPESQVEESLGLPEETITESQPEVRPPLDEIPEEIIPDWVKNASGVLIEEDGTEIEGELTKEELPDWIKEVLPPDTLPETLIKSEKLAEAELPDWIKSDYGEVTNEPSSEPEMTEEKLPDWIVEDFSQLEEGKLIGSEGIVPTEELPKWIKEDFVEEPGLGASNTGIEPKSEELPLSEEEQPIPTNESEQVKSGAEEIEKLPVVETVEPWQNEFEKPQETTNALNQARQALHVGELETALSVYASLIKQRQELDAVIGDLSNAVYQYPMEIKMWINLGDAYMRKNLLAEALNAYNKAEELIR